MECPEEEHSQSGVEKGDAEEKESSPNIGAKQHAHDRDCVIEKLDSYAVILRNKSFCEKQLDFGDATLYLRTAFSSVN